MSRFSLRFLAAAALLSGCASQTSVARLRALPPRESIAEHCREQIGAPRIERVGERIYAALGYDLANTILIRTDDGNVIVDPGMSPARAARVREDLLAAAPGPVRAVVYTHSHIDHIGGASVWVEEGTEIWATDAFLPHMLKQYGRFQRAEAMRGQGQFGRHVPLEALPCSAIGRRVDIDAALESGVRVPTRTFSGQASFTIGGVRFELREAHGETHDQLFVWLPGERILLPGDNFYHAFPNLYTIRGTSARPVDVWIESLDAMRRLAPMALVPSHTRPVVGGDLVAGALRDYRDGIQWLRDDVVRRANAGMTVEEIVSSVGLPPHLAQRPFLQELYGQVDWSARAIYDNELGWFDGDPLALYPLAATETARRTVQLMGGSEKVLAAAREARAQGDPRWAAHLLGLLRDARAGDPEIVREELARSLEAVAAGVGNTNGRAYLLESSVALTETRRPLPRVQLDDALLEGIPVKVFMTLMSGRLIPERSAAVHESVVFRFGEQQFVLTIRRGVAELVEGEPLPGTPEPLAVVHTDPLTWKRLALQIDSPAAALLSGRLRIEGSQTGFLAFTNRFDREL